VRRHPNILGGFTFLEIVTALAILAIGILAVITLFPVGLVNSKRAAERTRAALLAYQQLQRYRAMGFAFVTSAQFQAAIRTYQTFTAPEGLQPDPYFLNWVTSRDYAGVPNGASAGTRIQEVTVTATWPANQAPQNRRQLQMSTLISER
jgi:Tfp pilus assembly protein PilV